SAVMRQGWDGSTLASMTKSSPYRATGAHVSIIGHITAEELTRLLSQCDQANGFANRFLWVCCRRSKLLPFGGRIPPDEVDRLQARLSEAAAFARSAAMIQWTRPAMAIWDEVYPRLTSPRPGALGMVSSRAEAHTLRLALLYTLLDRSDRIEPEHLAAALALWDYCQRSAAYLFGTTTGDRDADRILEALRACSQGLSRGEIRRACFGDNKSADHVASKLTILLQAGSVRRETVATAGRPAERWFAVGDVVRGNVKNVISPQATGPRTPYHVFHVPTYQGPPEDHSPSAGPGAVAADPADSAAGAHREKPDVLDHRGVDPTDPDAF
ncbi:MAG TPA: DUF3987 domain-containing protein, partial [Isosphaeraceae bacterium]|nr:DUF3987 domain-containing protein [Isosphaeraceae bacterium]